jgi:integrase
MALEMKETSRWWYARFLVNRKLRRFPLMEKKGGKEQRLEIKGRRPPSLKHPEKGDAAFLESYHRARSAHDRLLEEELSKKSVEDLAQRIIEAKTGTRLDFVKVEAVPAAWAAIPRKRQPSPQYVETASARLRSFAAFMRRNYPEAEDLAAVRADHIRAFLDREAARGISPRTWNIALKLLKTVFVKLEPNADAFRAYLKNATFRDEDTVHREPFKDDELDAILEAARPDEILRGPIVTALCTAMRRGDCCLLKWASVDMDAGFIEVRASKTGETAEIPILPMLRDELSRSPKTGGEYVFPNAAELYRHDTHALDRRLRLILARAGFVDEKTADRITEIGHKKADTKADLPELPQEEIKSRGLKAIDAGKMLETKRQRMKAIFTSYLEGKGLPAIAREMAISKSTVSLHLNEIEGMIGAAVLRRPPPALIPNVIRGALHAKKGKGQRLNRGSIRGWHSFRVAFVTRALAGGMPEELVRRVTGHTAVDVVRRHYFKPGREEFRREFEKAMPRLLMNGAKSRDERLLEIVESVTPKTWKRDKARLLAILAGKA